MIFFIFFPHLSFTLAISFLIISFSYSQTAFDPYQSHEYAHEPLSMLDHSPVFNELLAIQEQTATTQLPPVSEGSAPYPKIFSDSNMIDEITSHVFDFKMSEEHFTGTFNILSTCSSLGSAYAYIVPQLLLQYTSLGHSNPNFHMFKDVTANIIHVIPQHKTIKAEASPATTMSNSKLNGKIVKKKKASGNSGNDMQKRSFQNSHINHQKFIHNRNSHNGSNQQFNGSYSVHESGTSFSISPRNSIFLHSASRTDPNQDMWKDTSVNYTHPPDRQNGDMPEADIDLSFSRKSPPSPLKTPTRISEMNHYFDNSTSNVGVSFLESNGSTSSLSSTEINVDIESRVFNTFAFMPKATSSLVVPPNYAHYNFALYPLPTHVLPMFREVVKTRFSETMPTGLMVICYPTSLKMYNNCILPCLDLTLHQMLALNLISTHACEELTVPPSAECYSYEAQKRILEELPQAEILYSRQIIDYKASDWGYRWMSEDMMWIRETLAAMHVPSQTILKFMNMLTKNPTWSVSTDSDVSLFIVRKKPS